MTRSHTFSRALRRLQLYYLSFDRFTGLSVQCVIGQCEITLVLVLCHSVEYLALINRAGGLYGRILTEVVSTGRTQ